MAWNEYTVGGKTDADGVFPFAITTSKLGLNVYAMSVSVYEGYSEEPTGLHDAFFDLNDFSYWYNGNTGETTINLHVHALYKSHWFHEEKKVPYRREGMGCTVKIRYANG